ncbi:MAG: UvrD-helicase domain-containing protein [bacterium]|nr:UvrD-helicase domain-containing protein [bacterium]
MEHLAGLNSKQLEAATHVSGPLLVVAGAGAGKTKTITHRIINLIKEGVAPEKILAVTFTNKATKEMRERITAGIEKFTPMSRLNLDMGRPQSIPFVSTFHSLGVHIIKENAQVLGLTRYFTILDEDDAKTLIKNTIKELGYDPKQYPPGQIRAIISIEKGNFVSLERYRESIRSSFQELVVTVWEIYETKKAKEGALDFDDLLLKTVKLLKENEEIRKIYQDRWEYVHIDEYQDTNEVQYLMTRLLSEKHKNICVVGDADQNIYSWRGANLKNILSFEKDYPNARVVLLEENYRSTKNILEAANEVIKKNKYRPEKNLFTQNKVGEKIGLYEALDENDEADFVATKILEIIDETGTAFTNGLGIFSEDLSKSSAGEVAVLYRTNFQSRALEEAMIRYNIPYQVLGMKFFERKEIKDTLAYLKAALNPESLSDIKRIINFPARGIGKATLVKIFAKDTESLPVKTKIKIENFYALLEEIKNKIESEKASEVIRFTVRKSGIENELLEGGDEDLERLENIKELATIALKYDNLENGKGVEKLLEDAALASDQDSLMENENKKEKKDAIKLMTVHASKGLEFKYVFVVGLEEGLFPHRRDEEKKTKEDAEEERRLFYVALTRAKEKLFLSFANFRTIFGSRQINAPSKFIEDIPTNILEIEKNKSIIKTIYI